jgi:Fe-S-cluster containining protein
VTSLCDTCKVPGACCRSMVLVDERGWPLLFPVRHDDRMRQADFEAAGVPLPFRPVASQEAVHPDTGETGIQYEFSCSALGPGGRCTIYDRRPDVCRKFEAGSHPTCWSGRPYKQRLFFDETDEAPN